MGELTFRMRLLLIATSLALAAWPHTARTVKCGVQLKGGISPNSNQNCQRWLLELHQRPGLCQNNLSSRRETRALQRSVALKIQMELKTGLLVVMKLLTTNGPGRSPFSSTTPGSAAGPSSLTSG